MAVQLDIDETNLSSIPLDLVSRAGTSYVRDHNSDYVRIPSDTVRIENARSRDNVETYWDTSPEAYAIGTGYTVSQGSYASKNCNIVQVGSGVSGFGNRADWKGPTGGGRFQAETGREYLGSVYIALSRPLTGSETLRLNVIGVYTHGAADFTSSNSPTTAWQRVTLGSKVATASGVMSFLLFFPIATTSPITVYIADRVYEDVTGKTDTTTPSEAGDGFAYYSSTNGNSVNAQYVTDGTGSALPGPFTPIKETVTTDYYLTVPPQTESHTLTAGSYVLSVYAGAGSIVLSGGPTGTATLGSPVTFTLGSSTSVTFTVTGTVDRAQCHQDDGSGQPKTWQPAGTTLGESISLTQGVSANHSLLIDFTAGAHIDDEPDPGNAIIGLDGSSSVPTPIYIEASDVLTDDNASVEIIHSKTWSAGDRVRIGALSDSTSGARLRSFVNSASATQTSDSQGDQAAYSNATINPLIGMLGTIFLHRFTVRDDAISSGFFDSGSWDSLGAILTAAASLDALLAKQVLIETTALDAILSKLYEKIFSADSVLSTVYDDLILGTSGLVAYWPHNEKTGATVDDLTGSHPGGYQNSPTLGESGGILTSNGTAVGFDGAQNELGSIPSHVDLNALPFTIETWFYPTSMSGHSWLLSKAEVTQYQWAINFRSTSLQIQCWQLDGTNVYTETASSLNISLDSWNHLVALVAGTTTTFYLNGIELSSSPIPGSGSMASGTGSLYIGVRGDLPGNNTTGRVQGTAYYNRLLTTNEIEARYTTAGYVLGGKVTALIDALLNKVEQLTASADAILQAIGTQTVNVDGLLQKVLTLDASVDAYLSKRDSKTVSLDAILYTGAAVTASLDAVMSKLQTAQAGLDSILILQSFDRTVTASADAILGKVAGVQSSMDSVFNKVQTLTAGMDSLLRPPSTEVVTNLDGLLILAGSVNSTLDAIIGKQFLRSASVDSILSIKRLLSATLDVSFKELTAAFAMIDAVLSGKQTKTVNLSAVLVGEQRWTDIPPTQTIWTEIEG